MTESEVHFAFIKIGEKIAKSLTEEIEVKFLVYQEHLLGFLANSVTASQSSEFVTQTLT